MKSIFKLIGIIALVTVIGFSFATCDDELSDDEGRVIIESSSDFTLYNYSKYEVNVTIKDKNSKKESKTLPINKGTSFYSYTPPINIVYSPASKVKTTYVSAGVIFNNK
jgi:hypothetical protein